MKNHKSYLLIISGILLAYKYFGVVIEKIPFTDIHVESEQNAVLILAALVVFFGSHYSWSWLRGKNLDDSAFEFYSTILIALFALGSVVYGYLVAFGVNWIVLSLGLGILVLGLLPAICIELIVTTVFSIRSKTEMTKMGVGRIPSASKAFFFAIAALLPLSLLIFGLILKYSYMLPRVLQDYWVLLFVIPGALINLENMVNILLLLGPSKLRNGALERLRLARRAMDIHEMHYQFIGVEKQQAYEIPEICRYAWSGDIDNLKRKLSNGEDPNIQDLRGWTSLMYASAENSPEIVDLLLDYGADPNTTNYLGRTALMYASSYGFDDIVRKLLSHGAIANVADELISSPPLSVASAKGHLAVVELLAENGADLNHEDSDGKSALVLSMENGHGEIAKYLRKKLLETDHRSAEDKAKSTSKFDWVAKR